jgi:hypothetical protein
MQHPGLKLRNASLKHQFGVVTNDVQRIELNAANTPNVTENTGLPF